MRRTRNTEPPTGRMLRPKQVALKLSIGKSTLPWKVKNDPDFPRPLKLGPRTTVFYESEIDAYLARCRQQAEAMPMKKMNDVARAKLIARSKMKAAT